MRCVENIVENRLVKQRPTKATVDSMINFQLRLKNIRFLLYSKSTIYVTRIDVSQKEL